MRLLLIIAATITGLLACENNYPGSRETLSLPRAEGIVVDGEFDDWNHQGIQIPLCANTWGEVDAESFFADVSLAWDDDFLYFKATVQDDSLFQDKTAPIWKNDGLELFLSAKKGSNQMIQYLVAPAITSEFPIEKIEKSDYRQDKDEGVEKQFMLESRVSESGYHVEAQIPFGSVGINPEAGDTIAFNFYIGDSDGSTQFRKYSWHYNDTTYLNHD
ncbi:MAG: sugar-binding protein, partial [Marinilabiliaceae bacterium]